MSGLGCGASAIDIVRQQLTRTRDCLKNSGPQGIEPMRMECPAVPLSSAQKKVFSSIEHSEIAMPSIWLRSLAT